MRLSLEHCKSFTRSFEACRTTSLSVRVNECSYKASQSLLPLVWEQCIPQACVRSGRFGLLVRRRVGGLWLFELIVLDDLIRELSAVGRSQRGRWFYARLLLKHDDDSGNTAGSALTCGGCTSGSDNMDANSKSRLDASPNSHRCHVT